MRIIGIDPGLEGAVCVLTESGPTVYSMPIQPISSSRSEIDVIQLDSLLDTYPDVSRVVLEKVQGSPSFGGGPAFTFGKGYGAVLAVLQLRRMPLLLVRPQDWKKVILAGTDKSKEAAVAHVQRLYPTLNLILPGCRKPSHDLAEAVCLALYGRSQT